MPTHDWSCVSAGTFHHFHTAWITELAKALHNGVLPASFYALAEQKAAPAGPNEYLKKQRTLVIRHTSNDRIVARIEILSPVNKNGWQTPADKPLTLAAHVANHPVEARDYLFAAGAQLSPMPLFLSPDQCVLVPLEETYAAAWTTLPKQIRESLAASPQ